MMKTRKMALAVTATLLTLMVGCENQIQNNSEQTENQVDAVVETETNGTNEQSNETLTEEELSTDKEESSSEINSLSDATIEVSNLELINLMAQNKEDFLVVVSAKTCGYCKAYEEETLNHYSKEEVGVHLIKVEWTDLSDEQKAELRSLTKLGIEVTPTTFLFENGESVEKHEDVLTVNDLINIVKK